MAAMRGACLVLLALSACGGRLPHPVYSAHKTDELFVVPYPPPPPRVEEIPEPEVEGSVWLDGEWRWRGRGWSWRKGRWVIPAKGNTWSPWTVTRDEAGTLWFAPGLWRNAAGAPVAAGSPAPGADEDPP